MFRMRNQMMILVLMGFFATISAEQDVSVVKNTYEALDNGYRFEYELSDAQKREEVGEANIVNSDGEAVIGVRGSYSYVGPDGVTYSVEYVADENGFRPVGDHIPGTAEQTVPAVGLSPNAIRSLVG